MIQYQHLSPKRHVRSGMLFLLVLFLVSCQSLEQEERVYLTELRKDFIKHKEDVSAIYDKDSEIVKRIDSLFSGLRKDTLNVNLMKGIMSTRAYDLNILAYKNILNGDYIRDPDIKIAIARHTARFEGWAQSKLRWDRQWDQVARPYIYENGLFKSSSEKSDLLSDPVFRSVLWDRRMFAHDVEIYTPKILSSADSVIQKIDALLR